MPLLVLQIEGEFQLSRARWGRLRPQRCFHELCVTLVSACDGLLGRMPDILSTPMFVCVYNRPV